VAVLAAYRRDGGTLLSPVWRALIRTEEPRRSPRWRSATSAPEDGPAYAASAGETVLVRLEAAQLRGGDFVDDWPTAG
jgi:hypothetical protein